MAATQSAVVRTSFDRHGVEVTEVATPSPRSGQVVIQVEYCGLCGSDLHIWRGDDGYEWVPCGTTLGHEIVGTIVELGADTNGTGFAIGDRVVPIAQTGCGECDACRRDYANGCAQKLTLGLSRDGGATTHLAVAAAHLLRVPVGLPALTAVLTEPASIAARAVGARGGVTAGDRVAVSGPGAVGQLCALVARHLGAEVVLIGTPSDVSNRAEMLAGVGLEVHTELPAGFSPTVWVEASGAQGALNAAIDQLPVQGKLVIVALYGTPPSVVLNPAVRKEVEIVTSYSSFRADYELALQVLSTLPRLGDAFVEVHELTEARGAFDQIGVVSAPKVALRPGSEGRQR